MEKNVNVYLFLYLIIFLEAYFCVSLFSTNIFPREWNMCSFTHNYKIEISKIKSKSCVSSLQHMLPYIINFHIKVKKLCGCDILLKVNIQKYAGDHFIKEYENLMNEDTTDSNKKLAKTMINLIKQQFIKLKVIEQEYITPNYEQYKQVAKLKPDISYTCKLPYPIFSTLFMATSAVWEVVII
ncbi:hypothetical protein PFMG_01522 [Plasmodium falciparum IGH-CR14]|uniref:Uncharacterized protein n=1 Tax=Plasmodium falciparum IGH-CR14 TaxID=580059 RepID=A0A0L1I6T1_PLAFA|nr:hypothetical protein PFMG_01522 [Plasmodium falciparum IGH-CR14]